MSINMNDTITFADGPLKGQTIRKYLATETIEGEFDGRYELATVMYFSEENREYRTRQEYRHNAGFKRESAA